MVTVPDRSTLEDKDCFLSPSGSGALDKLQTFMLKAASRDIPEILQNVSDKNFNVREVDKVSDFGLYEGFLQMGHYTRAQGCIFQCV